MIKTFELDDVRLSAQSGRSSLAMPKRILVTSDIRDLSHVWPQANEFGVARCYAFQCADVLELNQRTVAAARNAKSYFFAVMNAADEPLALFPLSIERTKLMRVLTFVDGGVSDYNAPVVFPSIRKWTAEDMEAVWDNLQKILRPDLVRLEKVPDCVGDLPNPLRFLGLSQDAVSAHAMTLSGTWQEVSARIPRRKDIETRTRRLGKYGNVEFELAKTIEEYDVFIETLIRQKTNRYLETKGVDGLDRPGYRSFLRGGRDLIYPSGPVCLFALKVDDTVIATHFGLVANGRFFGLFAGFEGGKWGKYSAGHIVHYRTAEWCLGHGIKILDFGIGDEAYKREYCDLTSALQRADVPLTINGRIYFCVSKARRRWSRKVN